jgi:single-strand DNA-binding protein
MSTAPTTGTNLSILVGVLSRTAEPRTLPSGDQLVALDVTVRREGAPAESVAVSWPGRHPTAARWEAGEEVLVTGRVRRRFFRAGGSTQSRTEVVATTVVPTRRAAAASKALTAAMKAVPRRL